MSPDAPLSPPAVLVDPKEEPTEMSVTPLPPDNSEISKAELAPEETIPPVAKSEKTEPVLPEKLAEAGKKAPESTYHYLKTV